MTIADILQSTWDMAEIIRDAELEAKSLEERCTRAVASLNGMPSGGGEGRAQDVWAEYADALARVDYLRKALADKQLAVQKLLWKLKDTQEYEVMFRRYVRMQNWQQITSEMGYSRVWLNQKRIRAIERLKETWRCE